MSFIDGIVNAARSVIGLSPRADDDRPSSSANAPAPARSAVLASSTPTGFARPSEPLVVSPTRDLRPTLAQRLQAARPIDQRSTPSLSAAGVGPTLLGSAEAAATGAVASIRDASTGAVLGTAATLMGSDNASVAARNVQAGIDYYARSFGRDGLDGAGAGVDVLVDDRSTDAVGEERFAGNGGYYATPDARGGVTEAIHFGVGTTYAAARGHVVQGAMQHADDLAIHELTHGIIRKETGHLGGEADEAGATNEAVADVMAAAATRDWSIGEGMYAAESSYRRMRNIADPDDPTAIHGLYTSIDQVRARHAAGEEAEEHWASGVISTAAFRMQQRLGGEQGWQAVERVFYDTIDRNRMGDMSFTAVASALRTSAATVYGPGSAVATVVDEELRRGGL